MTATSSPFVSRHLAHSFAFFRAGGSVQVRIESAADLLNLEQLDRKLWVALACPTRGLAIDRRTLDLIDTDNDGRIRTPELLAAVKWTTGLVKTTGELLKGSSELQLGSINESAEEGPRLLSTAKVILSTLKKGSASAIGMQDVMDAVKAFNALPFNGDGVIVPASASTDAERDLLESIVACVGSTPDSSGTAGVNAAQCASFFDQLAAYQAWLAEGRTALPFGADQAQAAAAHAGYAAMRAKIDDHFLRSRLASFDARALEPLRRDEKDFQALSGKVLSVDSDDLRQFPLSKVDTLGRLELNEPVNPAWIFPLATFRTLVVRPLLGDVAVLSESDWSRIQNAFAPYEAWHAKKPTTTIERLGAARLGEIDLTAARAAVDDLFAKERQQEPTAQSLLAVEKLVRFTRDLVRLLNNFVSFKDFYERKTSAIFQAGTLYIDQRAAELCLRVEDAAKHAALAPMSQAYLAYCDCTRPGTNEKMGIVAALTAGEADNLSVGRNGIFFDRDGKDWDATITRIVSNPINIRQAFWAPYKSFVRFIENQVSKRAAAKDAAAQTKLEGALAHVEDAATKGAPEAPRKPAFDVGVIAAMGVAVGGITAAIGGVLQAVFGLGLWMPLGVLGLVLLISGPSMLIAWLKLRQRNIGPLLDANGWAINTGSCLSRPLGRSLTKMASLPPGARVDAIDPFADKARPWAVYLAIVVVLGLALAWSLGRLDGLLPNAVKSSSVLKTHE
jgi:hypothetical protein